jgi:hypothetical protein
MSKFKSCYCKAMPPPPSALTIVPELLLSRPTVPELLLSTPTIPEFCCLHLPPQNSCYLHPLSQNSAVYTYNARTLAVYIYCPRTLAVYTYHPRTLLLHLPSPNSCSILTQRTKLIPPTAFTLCLTSTQWTNYLLCAYTPCLVTSAPSTEYMHSLTIYPVHRWHTCRTLVQP